MRLKHPLSVGAILSVIVLCFAMINSARADAIPEYDRDQWSHWEDFDRDCQNTRQEILITLSDSPVTYTSDTNCTVKTGLWFDKYTSKTLTSASDVDMDHIIPLKYAHDAGGYSWSALSKKLFANDPDNLIPVYDRENQSKGAKGPSEYLPVVQYHCQYIEQWKILANKYELKLPLPDMIVITSITKQCNK